MAQNRRNLFLDRIRREVAPGLAPGALGLAVSGGGDSVAMLFAMAELSQEYGWTLSVATVDHGLRPEAAEEARLVAQICTDLEVPHQTLRWLPPKTMSGNLMDAARRARYALLAAWARDLGRVAVAHTADDQAETLLIGLSRAAGLDGLSGLRPEWTIGGVRFLRPFLAVTREDLRRFLTESGQTWVEDPTNDDPAFDRVRARKALHPLRGLGITPDRLARVARNLAAVQADLRQMVAEAAARVVTEQGGGLLFDRAALAGLPDEIARRLVQSALLWLSAQDYPPREAALARSVDALRKGRAATLWGCRIVSGPQGALMLREPRAVGPGVPLGQVWDGRWIVTGPGDAEVRAVGAAGLAQITDWRQAGLTRAAALVTPGVWHGDRLMAAPMLNFGKEYTATLTAGFGLFLLSH